MPKCIVCDALLPPEFLEVTPDGKARKCVFCTRNTETIRYFSQKENKEIETTKPETIKEYIEFLKELSRVPTVGGIVDVLKSKGPVGD